MGVILGGVRELHEEAAWAEEEKEDVSEGCARRRGKRSGYKGTSNGDFMHILTGKQGEDEVGEGSQMVEVKGLTCRGIGVDR